MIAIVSIGDEVLYGFSTNTNAAYLSQSLIRNGLIPHKQITIGDDPQEMKKTIRELLASKMTVITTGGLGPTCDDLTRAVAAELFCRPLVRNLTCEESLIKRFGKDLPTLENQSLWPLGAQLFPNNNGTAFGFALEDSLLFESAKLICLPGPPLEMRPMFDTEVLPLLSTPLETIFITIQLAGIYEHEIDPYLRLLRSEFPNLHLGIYPSYGTVSIHIRAHKKDAPDAQEVLARLKKQFEKSIVQGEFKTIEEALVAHLQMKNWTIACAESCTGGALSGRLTTIPGVSEVFLGSIVSYSNAAKEALLGVARQTLEFSGAVSENTTHEMALGAKKRLGSDLAIAVSGIFGPGGGSLEKPVGTVCYTICIKELCFSGRCHFLGDRATIREKTVQFLLIECYKRLISV